MCGKRLPTRLSHHQTSKSHREVPSDSVNMPNVDTTHLNRPMKVLSLGLAKTGTASLAEAYRILGYQDVHHGLPAVLHSPSDFRVFKRAADATFPTLPTYTGTPFTRRDWDEVFGPCEAVTDIAAFFAPQLVEAYPEAKVVLCERPRGDVEAWFRSIDAVFDMTFGPVASFFIDVVEPIVGSPCGPAARNCKQILALPAQFASCSPESKGTNWELSGFPLCPPHPLINR